MSLTIGAIGSPEMLNGPFERRRELLDQVQAANIDHLFIADHISFHTGMGMDGIVNAATLAAQAPDIDVFIGVYLLALRHPVPVARQLSTLSLSAPGRITLGVGIGGEDRHEMEICGVDPAKRGRHTNHSLAALRGLLSGEKFSYDCEFFAFEDALIKPAPEPAVPMVIGGRSDAALDRAGRYGDGWLGVWCSARRFGEALDHVSRVADDAGRGDVPWQHGLQMWVGIDEDEDKAREIVAQEMEAFYRVPFAAFEKYTPYGSPEKIAEFIAPYAEAGGTIFNIKACGVDDETEIAGVGEISRLLKS